MLWIFPDFLLVSSVLYSAQYCLRLIFGKDPSYNGERLTDFSGGRWVIWLCCAVCVAASLFIAPTPASLDFWSATIVPYVSLAIFFVLLPLVYAAGTHEKMHRENHISLWMMWLSRYFIFSGVLFPHCSIAKYILPPFSFALCTPLKYYYYLY